MKKILGIIVLGLLLSGNAYSNEGLFNVWLKKNGHQQYLNTEQSEKCKSFDKGDTNWYYNNCDEFRGSNNLDIKIKNKAFSAANLAYHSNPNRDTLIYYLWAYSYRDRSSHLREFKPCLLYTSPSPRD